MKIRSKPVFALAAWIFGTSALHARPILAAHRGGAADAPENTLAAFAKSQLIADYEEFDIQQTADGKFVVMHDDTVDRTTSGTGAVSSLTLQQIELLDAGAKFSQSYAGEKVPSAEQALKLIQRYATPLMEVKQGSLQAVLDLLKQTPLRSDGIVMSFDYNLMVNLKRAAPTTTVGWIGSSFLTRTVAQLGVAHGIRHFVWPSTLFDAASVADVHALNAQVFAWTIDDLAEMRRLIAMGVDGIISDRAADFAQQPEFVSALATLRPTPILQQQAIGGGSVMLTAGVLGKVGRTIEWRRGGTDAVIGSGPTLLVHAAGDDSFGSYIAGWQEAGLPVRREFQVSKGSGSSGLENISVRGRVGPIGETIVGFVVRGKEAEVLIRGIGPTLLNFGVPDPIRQPVLTLYSGATPVETVSTRWALNSIANGTFERDGAFPLGPESADTAVDRILRSGVYTVLVASADGTEGTGLVEVYRDPSVKTGDLSNLSVRGSAVPGDPLIAGFSISGSVSQTLLIRGIGPALLGYGVTNALRDPVLKIYRNDGALIAASDDGFRDADSQLLKLAAERAGAFDLIPSSLDCAVLLSLPAGIYSAVLEGPKNGPGASGLVEIYRVDQL